MTNEQLAAFIKQGDSWFVRPFFGHATKKQTVKPAPICIYYSMHFSDVVFFMLISSSLLNFSIILLISLFFFCHAASPPLLVLLVFVNIHNSLNKAFNFLQLSYARLLIKFIASGKLSKEDTPSCATLSNKLTISCIFVDSNITFSSYNTIFCIFLLFILIFLLDVLTRSEI